MWKPKAGSDNLEFSVEQRLDRKGWGRGGWKVEGQPWPHEYSRLQKIPAGGKRPQKPEIVGLSVNKWLSTKASWSWSLWTELSCFIWDPFAASAPGFVCLSSQSVSISQSQPEVPISDGPRSGTLLLTEQFSMQTDWCFPRLGLNLPWAPPKWPLCFLFIPASIFPLMGYFETSLIICGLHTPHIYAIALTFPT